MEWTQNAPVKSQGYSPKRGLAALVVAVCLCLGLGTRAQDFGVVEGFWFPELTCDLNVGWERIIFDWAQHQPTAPTDWHTLNVDDRWLKSANGCNREVVALLKNTPAWATTGIVGAGVPAGLYLPVDDPNNHWANFVRQTAHYYAPRGVHRFIIWNEPDISPETYGFEFDGTLEDYAQLVKVAYLAAKQGNPAAQIHLAGTTYWHDVNSGERIYLERLIEALANDPQAAEHGAFFDAVSLHIYFRTNTVYDIVQEVQGVLAQHGLEDKAIWINETNAPPTRDPEWLVERPVFKYSLEQQAAFLVQAAALGKAAGAQRIAVYKLYDQDLPPGGETFGILRPADQSLRPAFEAWRTVTTHMRAITAAQRYSAPSVDAVLMTRADGAQVLAAWSTTGETVSITLEAASGAVYDMLLPDAPQATFENTVTLDLAGAECNGDDPNIPCPVGGAVTLVVLPAGAVAIYAPQVNGTIAQMQPYEESETTP